MKPSNRRWWLLLLLAPVAFGFWRLRFDADPLDLLPDALPSVHGLKLFQQRFSNARELILTVSAPEAGACEEAARAIAARLSREPSLAEEVVWQPPWLEHPAQVAQLIASLWLNQPPEVFRQLAARLVETNLSNVLAATREELADTLSPEAVARLGYDPFGLTRLPENAMAAAPGFGQGGQLFASPDGRFRLIFIRASGDLPGYRECTIWLERVKTAAREALAPLESAARGASLGYTGRPAFVAEISASMRRDIILSVGGTAAIISLLFWLAHRRWKPLLWLLALLGLVLAGDLGLGGLLYGTINVVSMGFAAILLGLAVDYAVVHYQEAIAHPNLTVPEVRRAIAPGIFWAAATTVSAFLVLNFGGLPGLAQLGSLVAVGVALSAVVMIYAYLPPLFPERRAASLAPHASPITHHPSPFPPARAKFVFSLTALILLGCAGVLTSGWPKMDRTADALKPRDSQAYSTLDAIQENLAGNRPPLWVVIAGRDESEVARRLDAVDAALKEAVASREIDGYTLPDAIWPRPAFQAANRPAARALVGERAAMRAAALTNGFSEAALGLMDGILDTWEAASVTTNVFWPDNPLCRWIFEKLSSRAGGKLFAAGFLYPPKDQTAGTADFTALEARLPREGVWLSSWELLGGALLAVVKGNLWKLVLPMAALVLLSMTVAFRRTTEVLLSAGVLLFSGLCLLAGMRILGWSWNLLNLMALPLILGTGVDYTIFIQLALRRHGGDLREAHRSVGRALLLCGGTAATGFGTLGLSSNAGMSGLGRVCAMGIGANTLASVFLLPVWWKAFDQRRRRAVPAKVRGPSSLYRTWPWRFGLALVRWLPCGFCLTAARAAGRMYARLAGHRREVVIRNLLPVLQGDESAAERFAAALFEEFAVKLIHLWRFEGGATVDDSPTEWTGWERFAEASGRGRGVLLVTPHLGNWEFGGAFLARRGVRLLVLTQAEPDESLTELRRNSRARLGIETLVVGEDAFAFVEIIKRLREGATVALLVDRPPPSTAVTVEFFGRPFQASIAAAELARACGCAVLPVFVARRGRGYRAEVLPEITYDRAALGNRQARVDFTREILRAFEPAIRQHPSQWYHFVPVWPADPAAGA